MTHRAHDRAGAAWRRPAILVAAGLAATLLAGCSANAEPERESGRSAGSDAPITDHTEWQLAYASCMRDEGIDMPDPEPGGGGMRVPMDDMAALERASGECRARLGNAPAPDGREALTDEAMLERQLQAAQCLRDQGYDVADPVPGRALGIPSDISPEALDTCLSAQPGGSGAGQ